MLTYAIPGLTIIGETINDSVPSTKKLFDAGDWPASGTGPLPGRERGGLHRRERRPASAGVHGRDGPQDPGGDGQAALDRHARPGDRPGRPGGLRSGPRRRRKPILNSIIALRTGMFDLCKIQPFRPILLVSEQVVDGRSQPCRTAEETHRRGAVAWWRPSGPLPGPGNEDCIIDPGIAPIGSDCEGNLRADRRHGTDPRRPELRRRPHVRGPEQFHGHAPPRSGPTARRSKARWKAPS